MTSNERIFAAIYFTKWYRAEKPFAHGAQLTTCTRLFRWHRHQRAGWSTHRARAGSIGTIIVECCFIDDYGLAFPGAIGIDNDEKKLPAWRK